MAGVATDRHAAIGGNCPTATSPVRRFRAEAAIDMQDLIGLMTVFANLIMRLADRITSFGFNPLNWALRSRLSADSMGMLETTGGRYILDGRV